jgi:hypothetical protein
MIVSILPRRSPLLSLALVGALIVAAPFALSGCALLSPTVNIIDQDVGAGLGGTSIPSDFPIGEVPLISGEVLVGVGIGNDSSRVWNVTIKVGYGALDSITSELESAGFSATVMTESSEGSAITFINDEYVVLVMIGTDGDGNTIASYTVARVAFGE